MLESDIRKAIVGKGSVRPRRGRGKAKAENLSTDNLSTDNLSSDKSSWGGFAPPDPPIYQAGGLTGGWGCGVGCGFGRGGTPWAAGSVWEGIV